MPEINFTCPKCGVEIEADEVAAGSVSQCPSCEFPVMIPMPGIKAGKKIGGYEIIRRLGAGGMGEVWLARQTAMDRKIALKILSPALTTNVKFVERFLKEVKTSAKLEHSNIVTAHDAGVDGTVHYLAMSYVDGVLLEDHLKFKKILPEKEALRIVRSIAEALNYAWTEFHIIHRDVKPSNIMLDRKGTAKLMDMGISKSLFDETSLTITGTTVGTPFYMSPEQARADDNIDCRTDIYSLGATLYHLVTGEVPYNGSTVLEILTKLITSPFSPPQSKNPELSAACSALIEVMMEKNPDMRPKDWNAAIEDIDLVIAGKFPRTKRPDAGTYPDMQTTNIQTPNCKTIEQPLLSETARNETTEGQKKRNSMVMVVAAFSAVIAVVLITGFVIMNNSNKLSNGKKLIGEIKTAGVEPATKKDFEKVPAKSEAIAKIPGNDSVVPPKQMSIDLGGGMNMDFVLVQPGKFTMSNNKGDQHEVTLTKAYWIGKFEITQEQYEKLTGVNPSYYKYSGKDAPIENVSWFDAVEFCRKLTDKGGKSLTKGHVFRLPTEAEWEYAARGGQNSQGFEYSGSNTLSEVASSDRSYPVGRKKPNELGIHDMSGNVSEWCADWTGPFTGEPVTDPSGPSSGLRRIIRGGCCSNRNTELFRNAHRDATEPENRSSAVGFRVVFPDLSQAPKEEIDEMKTSAIASPTKKDYENIPAKSEAIAKIPGNDSVVPPKQMSVDLGCGVKMDFVLVQPGKFMMGGKWGHLEVTLTKPYWIGKFEVTQEQYQRVTGTNPSKFKDSGMDAPVESVSWYDAVEFCKNLSEKEGKALPDGNVFRLPTKAEWEYAAIGGQNSKGFKYSGSNTSDDAAWCKNNSGDKTNPVGKKIPNELGLYDMSGNVREWCHDWFGEYPVGKVTDPTGPATGEKRVNRSGSWRDEDISCVSINFFGIVPDYRGSSVGLRLAIGYPLPE